MSDRNPPAGWAVPPVVVRAATRLAAVVVGLGLLAVARRPPGQRAAAASLLPTHPPVLVVSPLRLAGAIVLGAAKGWPLAHRGPVRLGDPVPVEVTAYCLQGTTRRGRWVRQGIVAADPTFFPLARYIELYVGRKYLGRFLVDDTGGRIRGSRIDVWTPACRDARLFGRQKGVAVLVPRPAPEVMQAGAPLPTR